MNLGVLKVKIPQIKGKIVRRKRQSGVYVEYVIDNVYNKEKHNNSFTRVSIGKVIMENDKETEYMTPNDKFAIYFPNEVPLTYVGNNKRSSLINVGTYVIINKILDNYKLKDILENVLGNRYKLFLDLVAFSLITENNEAQHYPAYARNHPLFSEDMNLYSDSTISNFLKDLTINNEQEDFLEEWNKSDFAKSNKETWISYDSTNKNIQAGNLKMAEFGKAKQKMGTRILNLAIGLDQTNKVPLFVEYYNGSIIDVSQLQSAIKKSKGYGYKNCGFILDRGYFSENNLKFILDNGFHFLMMMKAHKDIVYKLVTENKGTFETDLDYEIANYGANGITTKAKLFKELKDKELYFHLYFSPKRWIGETETLKMKIKQLEEGIKSNYIGKTTTFRKPVTQLFNLTYKDGKLENVSQNKDNINKAFSMCGYFVIITSKEMDYKETLKLYKGRDTSEKLFSALKTFLGGKSFRAHEKESIKSKIFIEFVALIVRNKIYNSLHDYKIIQRRKRNYLTVPMCIEQLEMIELLKLGDGSYSLDHAITKQQKDILQAFDLDEQKMIEEVNKIATKLYEVNKKDEEEAVLSTYDDKFKKVQEPESFEDIFHDEYDLFGDLKLDDDIDYITSEDKFDEDIFFSEEDMDILEEYNLSDI